MSLFFNISPENHRMFLKHWGREKMAIISQTTLPNVLSRMKLYGYWLTFHWNVFLRVNNIPVLVEIMAWRRLGATSHHLNQSLVRLRTHICATRPRWFITWYAYGNGEIKTLSCDRYNIYSIISLKHIVGKYIRLFLKYGLNGICIRNY